MRQEKGGSATGKNKQCNMKKGVRHSWKKDLIRLSRPWSPSKSRSAETPAGRGPHYPLLLRGFEKFSPSEQSTYDLIGPGADGRLKKKGLPWKAPAVADL